MAKAPLIEVFASVQGEGRHVGVPMAFVRVAVCPIRCAYCDTPESYTAPGEFPVRLGSSSEGSSRTENNPVQVEHAVELAALAAGANSFGETSWVSLTGGEPLLYPAFVAEFGAGLRARGLRLFLETAAIDRAALHQCVAEIDHLSLDYKLPGTLLPFRQGIAETLEADRLGRECVASVGLAAARGSAGPTIDVKMVLTADATETAREASYRAALSRLQPFAGQFRLFLQPVTPFGAVGYPCPPERVARFAVLALEHGLDTRVLPQVHKLLDID